MGSLFDLMNPTVEGGLTLVQALNGIRNGTVARPPDVSEGMAGLMPQEELPPAPAARTRLPVDDYLDQCRAEARQQEAIDSYEMKLRLRAKGIENAG